MTERRSHWGTRSAESACPGSPGDRAVDHPWHAALLDVAMWTLKPLRQKIVPEARGRVLEIGVGTGMNFPYYRDIESLHGIEPDPHMLRRARARADRLRLAVELTQAGAEALPYDDASFDTAVVTWVLCTIPDAAAAVREVARVLRPGGRMLFVEHVRSRYTLAGRVQDALTPAWSKLSGGCRLNRDSVDLIRSAAFASVEARPCGRQTWTIFPICRGSAIRRG